MIHRIYVEKKAGFDVAAKKIAADIKAVLGIENNVRLLIRYDMQGAKADFEKAVSVVFSEPPVDEVYFELPNNYAHCLAVELLPGQYDQRADSAAICVQMLCLNEKPLIKCAVLYLFEKSMTDTEYNKIKKFLINPVESKEADLDVLKKLEEKIALPSKEKKVDGFIKMSLEQLADYHKVQSFGFTFADIKHIQNYFIKKNRDPYFVELKVLDIYWSDHCRHTTFNTELTSIKINSKNPHIQKAYDLYNDLYAKHKKDGKYKSLMSMATIAAKELDDRGLLPHLDKSKEINACSIKIDAKMRDNHNDGAEFNEKWTVMFKNETHNHPTEIEPFGGAATCVGGAIRDPLSGRVYVYQSMRISGAADINQDYKDTIKGKLPQRVISKTAASGFSSYGNQIGLATGLVKEVFHPGYAAKRMEVGFVVGAAKSENIIREEPLKGDVILLIGGATGRDGVGGAVGSSKSHDQDSVAKAGAEVQKGNAITERKLQRLFRNSSFSKLIKRCNDFGAGGVSVAVGEIAESIDIDLDMVPVKQTGLSGLELAISESQERMAVVVDAKNEKKIKDLCGQENVEVAKIAVVTDSNKMRMKFNGEYIVDLDRDFIDTNGVRGSMDVEIVDIEHSSQYRMHNECKYLDRIKKILSSNSIASQKGMVEMFDSTIGAGSVLMPFGGKSQIIPSLVMAAKLPVLDENITTDTVTISSFGFDPFLSEMSPFLGGVYAVLLSVIKIAIAGADYDSIYLSLQEYFEKLGVDPIKWGKPTAALLGALTAQVNLKKAAIGGKDSMSGSFENLHVPPTLISFALGIGDVKRITNNVAERAGINVLRYHIPKDKDGMPDFEAVEKFLRYFDKIRDKLVFATVSEEGGTAIAMIKSLMGNDIGFEFFCMHDELFENDLGDIIFGVKEPIDSTNEFKLEYLGITKDEAKIVLEKNNEILLAELKNSYTATFENVFPTMAASIGEAKKTNYHDGQLVTRKTKIAKPRVFIPVFPGTNCEIDTARAFEKAGAVADIFVIKNLSANDMIKSVDEIIKRISQANIIAIPGGFSGADEPDGSGKFIASTFSNPYIKDAIENLLYVKDGLMLGICNGFQALIKLGLLPYGKILPLQNDSPTLTFNNIGRHVSGISQIRIASNLSPWLSSVKVGEVYSQAISHGEGRFFANEAHIKRLVNAGQVATQYVNNAGQVTMLSPFNPNGSVYAIEGITSPCGRVLGKMGHSERICSGLYQNVDGNYDMKLFLSGVKYYD
ncbi:MAG: phosphoribosylformylglycinamidine synthase [Firmicutes bacterium]|nr:phosphoribosylformylglycinamidine synthase [Bacillota bacterium]